MYTVIKELEFSAAHNLNLDYESKCENLHGHNWKVKITCQSSILNNNGMVIDFKKIKDLIQENFDHKYLNEELVKVNSKLYPAGGCGMKINPTAELIAFYISQLIQKELEKSQRGGNCIVVEVQESNGNTAIYDRRR